MKVYPCSNCKCKQLIIYNDGERWGVKCGFCSKSTPFKTTRAKAVKEWNYWNVNPTGEMVVI